MADHSLIFPGSEFEGRVSRLQAQMAKDGIATLLLTLPADIFYVTGFLTRFWESPARPWFVVVPTDRDPIAVIPSIGAELMGRTWITDIRTWDAPNPNDDGISLLVDTIQEVTPDHASLGTPLGLETHIRMPGADFASLQDAVLLRKIIDATASVQRVREIKSEPEIECIRATCAIADRAFERVPEFAEMGRPLDEVFRAFQIACLEEGADWVSYVAGAADQGGYGDVISPAGPEPLAQGDILMLDTGAVRDGYFCDFDRNFAIGTPSDAAARTHAALWRATEKVLQTLRPGHTASDVHRMLCRALDAEGATPGGGRLGHGLGVTLTEWPSFTPRDHTPLRAGMVLTLEPSALVTPGRMIVQEENIVLRDDGAELLSTRAPENLPVIPV